MAVDKVAQTKWHKVYITQSYAYHGSKQSKKENTTHNERKDKQNL